MTEFRSSRNTYSGKGNSYGNTFSSFVQQYQPTREFLENEQIEPRSTSSQQFDQVSPQIQPRYEPNFLPQSAISFAVVSDAFTPQKLAQSPQEEQPSKNNYGENTGNFRPNFHESEASVILHEIMVSPKTQSEIKVEKQTQVSNCCHEASKQIELLKQKLFFKDEQIQADRAQAKKKEAQYNYMIEALKASTEKSNADEAQGGRLTVDNHEPQLESNKTEIQDQIRRQRAENDLLQQKILESELQLERASLDFKISIQKKDDEVYELKMLLKHKENELRTLQSNYDRTREDFTYRLQESLDKLHDRLTLEKHQDIQDINQRNEVLIKQLVEFQSQELRSLREQLLQAERNLRNKEFQIQGLEFNLSHQAPGLQDELQWSEQQRMANMDTLNYLQTQHNAESSQLKDSINQMESHIANLQDEHSKTVQTLIVSEKKNENHNRTIQQLHTEIRALKKKDAEQTAKAKQALLRERKITDQARAKVLDHEKCETALYKKITIINELRAKIQKMEIENRHKEKLNIVKRKDIEEEKVKLRQDCISKQRSFIKSNLSATRAQQVIENKQAVIEIERGNKKALQQELIRLQHEMSMYRRERDLQLQLKPSESNYFTKSSMLSPGEYREKRNNYYQKSSHESDGYMARSLIIGELTQDASADNLSGISPHRNMRHSVEDKLGKLLKTPQNMNHLKFVGGDVSPVRPNLTEHDRIDQDKSADFMKVFTDSESNISGEPQISKQKSLLVHPGQKVLGGNSKQIFTNQGKFSLQRYSTTKQLLHKNRNINESREDLHYTSQGPSSSQNVLSGPESKVRTIKRNTETTPTKDQPIYRENRAFKLKLSHQKSMIEQQRKNSNLLNGLTSQKSLEPQAFKVATPRQEATMRRPKRVRLQEHDKEKSSGFITMFNYYAKNQDQNKLLNRESDKQQLSNFDL